MRVSIAGFIVLLLLAVSPDHHRANAGSPGPGRQVIEQREYTAYIWVVGAWDFESCRIITDTIEAVPQYKDIAAMCGIKTTSLVNSGAANLYYLNQYTYLKDTVIKLPEIIIKTDYDGSGSIIVTAADPLPGQAITRIEASINNAPAVCDDLTGIPGPAGSLRCEFPLYNPPIHFTAYALSSFGDRSRLTELRIGKSLARAPFFTENEGDLFILGDNAYTHYSIFNDIPLRWGVIPAEPVPAWLLHVQGDKLITDHYYYYLAGQLLLAGVTAAPDCYNSGILGQYSTNCGLLAAFPYVYQYQNAYNKEINAAAAAWGIPNVLIKRVIAVESQFYTGALGQAGEDGLYQFTRSGADTMLRWNGSAYLDICGQYFDNCDLVPYDNMAAWQRDLMINYIMADPNNINNLAAALKANAYQVDRLINNIIGSAGDLDYSDLWKLTIVNYHTGATVTSAVLQQIQEQGRALTWDNYAAALEQVQPSGSRYIKMIINGY